METLAKNLKTQPPSPTEASHGFLLFGGYANNMSSMIDGYSAVGSRVPGSKESVKLSKSIVLEPAVRASCVSESNRMDTTSNLRSLDKMLGTYRDLGREQKSSIERIRTDLSKTQDELQDERLRSSVLMAHRNGHVSPGGYDDSFIGDCPKRRPGIRDYDSDNESPGRRRKRKSSVRFADDMNKELHDLHQTMRDLSQDHVKLEESFSRELTRRDRDEYDTQHTLKMVKNSMQRVSPHTPDPAVVSVDRRLQTIQDELQSERRHMDRRYEEIGSLSSEMKQALLTHQQPVYQPQTPPPVTPPARTRETSEDIKLRSHVLQSEALRHKAEAELDHVKRKLDECEGGRSALQNQIDELKSQLSRADQEKARIKSQVVESRIEDDVKDKQKQRAVYEEIERERQRFQAEISELRSQLSRTVNAAGELDEIRRNVERSERQRLQLSDHIEVVTKDFDNKEKQIAKVLIQLKDMTDKYDDAERNRHQNGVQLEDALGRLKEVTRDLEKSNLDLRESQQNLMESDRKREEFKGRAQETVRQWKLKCKHLERSMEREKHNADQATARNEQLIRELEGMKNQSNSGLMQIEHFRKEMGDILAMRASQDEQLRVKEVELSELKASRLDMEREARDARTVADKLENELHAVNTRLMGLLEDRNRFEDQLSSAQAGLRVTQDQIEHLQRDLKETHLLKLELAAKLSDLNAQNQDLKLGLSETQHREQTAQEEFQLIRRQIKEERGSYQAVIEGVKREVGELKGREQQLINEFTRRFKQENAELEAGIQTLKMELSEEKSSVKLLRKQDGKMRTELERLHGEVQRYEEENTKFVSQLERAKHEFVTQSQMAEDDLSRVQKMEEDVFKSKESLAKSLRDHLHILNGLSREVDSVLNVAAADCKDKYQALNNMKNSGNTGADFVVAEMKSKLQWLKSEVRDKMKRERKLKRNFREVLDGTDNDRQYLVSEIAKKDDALDTLSAFKDDLLHSDETNLSAMEILQEQIVTLTDQLEEQRVREQEQSNTFSLQRQHVIDEIQDTQKERERIQERYNRLQSTMKQLQDELKDTKLNSYKNEIDPVIRVPTSTPKNKTKTVRIHDSPLKTSPKRNILKTPEKSSDKHTEETPPPLSLSEEEFQYRFLLKSHEGSD